jgi:hypothetical protein
MVEVVEHSLVAVRVQVECALGEQRGRVAEHERVVLQCEREAQHEQEAAQASRSSGKVVIFDDDLQHR